MSTRKVWYGLAISLILVSLASLATRGLNLGVDFTGGVTVQASFPSAANRDAVIAALTGAGYADPQVTIFGTSREIAIRLPPTRQTTEEVRGRIEQILHGIDAGATIQQVEVVGPQIGGELQRSATQALVATLLLIFGYLAVRFHTGRRLDPVAVLDQSINQTLSRTIMTKVVTLIVVVALYALGGPVLRGFSEALIIGILAGTYSSIYISSAVALDCGLKAEHLLPSSVKRPVDSMP